MATNEELADMSLENLLFMEDDARQQVKISQAIIDSLDLKISSNATTKEQRGKFWNLIATEKIMIEEAKEEINQIKLARKSQNLNS